MPPRNTPASRSLRHPTSDSRPVRRAFTSGGVADLATDDDDGTRKPQIREAPPTNSPDRLQARLQFHRLYYAKRRRPRPASSTIANFVKTHDVEFVVWREHIALALREAPSIFVATTGRPE